MSDINIFLASSIVDLVHDRNAIGNFVRRINDKLKAKASNQYVRLFMCEFEDASISALGRKQEEYNAVIRKADLFLILFFNHAGEFTLEELDIAIQAQRPNILPFFRVADNGTAEYNADETLETAISHLAEHNIQWKTYTHIDQVKQALLAALENYLPAIEEMQ